MLEIEKKTQDDYDSAWAEITINRRIWFTILQKPIKYQDEPLIGIDININSTGKEKPHQYDVADDYRYEIVMYYENVYNIGDTGADL